MKKILFLVIALSIITGTSFALFPGLFPNTANFPRIPTGDGTIGKVLTTLLGTSDLENYAGDGTAPNSLALSGISASGYLKNTTNCPGTEKYIGIDADGKRICGAASTILAQYGSVESQDCPADYYRIDETQGTTSTGDILIAGDVIKTAPSCTLTIVFADLSIMRLDGDTTISLDLGTLADGTSIASAIIANGSIWGRILTETGSYNIGTETVVVGVRGTSISVVSTGNTLGPITLTATGWNFTKIPSPNNTLVDIIDSQSSAGAKVFCRDQSTKALVALPNMSLEKSLKVPSLGCSAVLPSLDNKTASDTFAASSWIRKNTKKDLFYMYHLRSLSGAILSPTKDTVVKDEITMTIPARSATGVLTLTGSLEANQLCETTERWWDERYKCQNKKIVALVDFTMPLPGAVGTVPPLAVYTTGGTIVEIPATKEGTIDYTGNGTGVVISNANSYISYDKNPLFVALGISTLQDMKITIGVGGEMEGLIGSFVVHLGTTPTQNFIRKGLGAGNYICTSPPDVACPGGTYSPIVKSYYYKITNLTQDWIRIGGTSISPNPKITVKSFAIYNP